MTTNAALAAKLLRASSNFFRAVGEQNPELKDQMTKNADACELIANRVEVDPLGSPSAEEENDVVRDSSQLN
jgi:hypothetical protein